MCGGRVRKEEISRLGLGQELGHFPVEEADHRDASCRLFESLPGGPCHYAAVPYRVEEQWGAAEVQFCGAETRRRVEHFVRTAAAGSFPGAGSCSTIGAGKEAPPHIPARSSDGQSS